MTRQSTTSPEEHLRRVDPVLGAVMDDVAGLGGALPSLLPDPVLSGVRHPPSDCWEALVRAVAGQNVPGAAAEAVHRGLPDRFDGRLPTPREVLAGDPEELRAATGLSRPGSASLRSLAEHVISGQLALDRLHTLSDEHVVAQLSAVRGVGSWTADQFLIRHLRRPDVLPVGDPELRRTAGRLYGLHGPAAPTHLERLAEPWRPHRTLACLYLWRAAAPDEWA